ncbi:hypothetical protein Tco_0473114 [Tanacetum coccineum]
MFSYTRLGIDNDHHFTKNTANNLLLRGGHSIVDPSCDVLSLGALCSWEFFLKILPHASALAVLVTGASQSRQHESHHRFFPVDTSLIHIESRKSPTKSLFDVGSRRISIFTVNTKEYHSDVLAIITRIMRRT